MLMCLNSLFYSSITFKPFSSNKYNMQWVVVIRPAFIVLFQFPCMFFQLSAMFFCFFLFSFFSFYCFFKLVGCVHVWMCVGEWVFFTHIQIYFVQLFICNSFLFLVGFLFTFFFSAVLCCCRLTFFNCFQFRVCSFSPFRCGPFRELFILKNCFFSETIYICIYILIFCIISYLLIKPKNSQSTEKRQQKQKLNRYDDFSRSLRFVVVLLLLFPFAHTHTWASVFGEYLPSRFSAFCLCCVVLCVCVGLRFFGSFVNVYLCVWASFFSRYSIRVIAFLLSIYLFTLHTHAAKHFSGVFWLSSCCS